MQQILGGVKSMKRLVLAVVLTSIYLSGCFTVPNQAATSSAGYVGDRASTTLDEIVVSVPSRTSEGGYQNLHIVLAAVVSPKSFTIGSVYEVLNIVRRMQPRVSSRVTQHLLGKEEVSISTLPDIREEVAKLTEEVLKSALQAWSESANFEIEILVTSMFFTDASVGKEQRGRWW